MNFESVISAIKSKEDFMDFLVKLRNDKEDRSEEWENKELISYFDGICSWVDDMEGYFQNMHMDMPTNIDWGFIAVLFYVGKIYE